jgi:protein TonB
MVGFGFVVLLHVVLIWALANGMAQKVMRLVHPPMKVKIEEAPPPPPPKDLPPPPPPSPNLPPPPIFIPPVEVNVTPPPVVNAPVVASTTEKPAVFQPPSPPAAAPAPVAAAPATLTKGLCSNLTDVQDSMSDKFSVIADKEGITSATATAILVLGPDGRVKDVSITGTNYNSLKALLRSALPRLNCKGQGVDVTIRYPVDFKLSE